MTALTHHLHTDLVKVTVYLTEANREVAAALTAPNPFPNRRETSSLPIGLPATVRWANWRRVRSVVPSRISRLSNPRAVSQPTPLQVASSLVLVKGLAVEQMLVEIEAIAAKAEAPGRRR